MPNPSVVVSKYLRTAAAARFLAVGESTLEKLRCFGGGPKFSKLGRIVTCALPDLEAWAESRRVGSTSEADARRAGGR